MNEENRIIEMPYIKRIAIVTTRIPRKFRYLICWSWNGQKT